MNAGMLLQIIMVIMGILLFCITIISLAKKNMNESFCLVWGIVALTFIFAGILLRPTGWTNYISYKGLVLIIIIVICAIYVAYFMSAKISEISKHSIDTAIQLSLINEYSEKLEKRVKELEAKLDEKDSHCN